MQLLRGLLRTSRLALSTRVLLLSTASTAIAATSVLAADAEEEAQAPAAAAAAPDAEQQTAAAAKNNNNDDDDDDDDDEETAKKYKFPCIVKYVIIGAGTAGFAAMLAIRERDPDGSLVMIGKEKALPYMRPPLSKELWSSKDENVASTLKFTNWANQESSLEYKSAKWFQDNKVDLVLGHEVVELDLNAREVILDNGRRYQFEKLLLAMGGSPNEPPGLDPAVRDRVTTFRTVEDFRRLDPISRKGQTFAVIGGSFLGTELAYVLGQRVNQFGGDVIQIFPEPSVMARNFPRYLSDVATAHVNVSGVTVRPNRLVTQISEGAAGKVKLTLDNQEVLEVDHVVVAVGITPNIKIAEMAGLEIDFKNGGIVVNSELEARSGVYVAGDLCSFFDPVLGRRRVEHHDHAIVSGRLCGRNMTGAHQAYSFQSMYWGDIGNLGYEALGVLDSSMETVSFWDNVRVDAPGAPWFFTAPPEKIQSYGKGVVYYLRGGRVMGILLFNNFGKVDLARSILGRKIPSDELAGKIPCS